jgi:CheY-like chemotaxis protein
MVAVSNSGCGMTKEVLARAFEPFFTTKEVGRGTGLGLSMVYGFVKQSRGHVMIYSEPTRGTTVELYFPRFHGHASLTAPDTKTLVPQASRDEVVLVVEDNDDVRMYSVMILNELGYHVLEASNAESALLIIESASRVDLLFTDVTCQANQAKCWRMWRVRSVPVCECFTRLDPHATPSFITADSIRACTDQQAVHVRGTGETRARCARQVGAHLQTLYRPRSR